jgi:hypothetical protein
MDKYKLQFTGSDTKKNIQLDYGEMTINLM